MPANLEIDLDNEARIARQQLDIAVAVTLASQVKQSEFSLNYSGALVNAITVKATCEFLLRYIPDRDADNRNRFKALLKEADKATLKFWKYFTVVTVETESGRQLTVTASEKPDNLEDIKPRKFAAKPPKSATAPERETFHMGKDKEAEIVKMIEVTYEGHLTQKEMREVGDAYGYSFSTISRIYYKHFGNNRYIR